LILIELNQGVSYTEKQIVLDRVYPAFLFNGYRPCSYSHSMVPDV